MLNNTTLKCGEELGDYRIVELLGAGGMGEVYRAVHTRIGREAAIKVLAADAASEDVARRFENEARIQADLSHDHVAALYDYIEIRGRRCLVMEFVPGESLAERLRRTGRLQPAEALRLLEQIAAAAAYMHARGIVHRDLKPSNVRITPDGRAKVLDFGIARSAATPALTAAGQVVGTPEYVSPEQLRTGRATPRSDVWALGVLLHEMVTGRVPFPGRFPNEVWSAIELTPRPTVATQLADTTHAAIVERVLEQCLAIHPADRFVSAAGIVEALRTPGRAAAESRPRDTRGKTPLDAVATIVREQWTLVCVAVATVFAFVTLAVFFDGDAAPGTTLHRIAVSEGSAEVVINGERVGRTPFEYHARHGEVVSLELRRPGFDSVVERFDISTRPVWTFTMRPAPQRGGRQ